MITIGKDFPRFRANAFCFDSENRASNPATSPARTECFDIFSPEPGDSDVMSQIERLSSKETKIAARSVWIAVDGSAWAASVCMIVSRVDGSQPHSGRALVAIHPHRIFQRKVTLWSSEAMRRLFEIATRWV